MTKFNEHTEQIFLLRILLKLTTCWFQSSRICHGVTPRLQWFGVGKGGMLEAEV